MDTSLASNPLLIGFIILCVVTLILLCLVIWMYIKLKRFLIGINSKTIEDSLLHVSTKVTDLESFRGGLETYLSDVEKRLRKGIRSVHTVRFNPFKGTGAGGNQSFATAFLNEEGDGVLISSLYSREHVSIFSKPLRGHGSEHELSEEEAEALENATKELK